MRTMKGFGCSKRRLPGVSLVPVLVGFLSMIMAQPADTTPKVLAIRGGRVFTITKGVIPNGTIILRDGKFAAVGSGLAIPSGAEVVDAGGKFITPGLVDEHSHIASSSTNEGGTTASSMTRILDVLDPTDVDIYRDLAGGLTVASVFHGSANPIGGTNEVIKLRWGVLRAEDLLMAGALPGLKFALGENPKDTRIMGQTGPRRYPASRPGVEYVLRDAFTRAQAYQRSWQEYERRKKSGEDVLPPRRDLQLEPIVEVLEGKRLAHVHAYRADEMLMMLRLAEEFGFRVATFEHGLEGYKIAKEIAAHGAGVGTFTDWWGYKVEVIDAIPYNAALMMRKGVLVSINSDSAEHARRLNSEAGKMVKWGGLTEEEALALVTIHPARQLRIDSHVGSIEPGKDADLVIWNQHPLSSYAVAEQVYIDGRLYYDRQADLKQKAELQKEKEKLVAAEKAEKKAGPQEKEPRKETEGAAPVSAQLPVPPADAKPASTADRLLPKMVPAAKSAGSLAIVNANIYPISGPAIPRGTILLRDGKIEALGTNVKIPSGTRRIDAAGGQVYPGWIDAKSSVGLTEPGPRGYQDNAEMLDYNPQLRTIVAYHNDSDNIPPARCNGVTSVAVFPLGGILGGQIPVMNLDGWTWEESALEPLSGIAFQFPSIQGRFRFSFAPAGEPEKTYEDLKKERDAKLDRLAALLDQVRSYMVIPENKRQTDWVLQSLIPVVTRRIPLFVSAGREQEIKDAVAFSEKVRVKIVLCAGPEAALTASLLKEKKIPVILESVQSLPTREDMFHAASYTAAGELFRAGVRFAFAADDDTNVRLLPYHAAQSVAWGLPREEALRALTLHAAEILGIADRVGSLEPGKMANLLIAKGDPLDVRTEITHVIIRGNPVDMGNRQSALYERYLRRP